MARTKGRAAGAADAKAKERQRILAAAETVFAERGFADARMQDVAAAARASLRSVYAVASGKAEIFRALHRMRGQELLPRIEAVLADETRDPADSLRELITAVATFLMDHPDFLRIQLREGRAWSLDDAKHPLVEERHASDRLLERLFRRGIRAGRFHDEDPKQLVASLRSLEQVHLAAWFASRGRTSKRAATEAIQRQAARLFCR